MNAVLEWVKANVIIVIFAVLMLAAAITLPILASGMNESLRKEVSSRAANLQKLQQLEKGEVLPGQRGVINENTLRRYEEVSKVMADDAAAVQRLAIEHNRKGRGVILPTIFPEPPQALMDVLPRQFHEKLVEQYGNLLAEVNAGTPPSLEALANDLDLVRKQFINQDLKKDESEALDADEQKQLKEKLTNARMSMYADAAEKIGMYLSMDQLGVPGWNQANQPSVGELFTWQWQYWVIDDIVKALHSANQDDHSVLRAPVKQLISIAILDLPGPSASGATPGGSDGHAGAAGFGAGGSSGRGGAGGAATTPAGSTGTPANPKAPVPKDYKVSITGHATNPLYDVVHVRLELIVETRRLPKVLDALANYNFMSVTGLKLRAVDPFAAVQSGYFYGTEPVSNVELNLETIWLRAWTQEFMPKSIKQTLGVPIQAAGASPSET